MQKIFIYFICLMVCLQFSFGQELMRKGISTPVGFDYQPETISLLSWNVEHFVDSHDNPYINNARENQPDKAMLGKEELLAKALRVANADIVVLQEFESVAYLKEIADRKLQGMGYQFFAEAKSYSWYMNVVIMSKVPLGTLYSYGALYTPVVDYVNDKGEKETQSNINTRMWSIDVLPNEDYAFALTAVHLKAGRGERNEKMRLGQINFLKNQWARRIKENRKANIMMVGDFNSTPDSKEMQTLLQGKRGNAFIDPLAGTQTYSHPSDAPRWRIDHIIYNKRMASEIVTGSVKVCDDLLSNADMIRLSDHLPMSVSIKVR